jgi:hypothetical protein
MKTANSNQITGNAGLYHAAWQLTRRGWHVMPTVRNARGSDLIVINDDESVFFGVQSKALSKRAPVPLGLDLTLLRSEWWIITIHARTERPVSFILSLDEVKLLAFHSKTGSSKWLQPPAYDRAEFREAWHRIDPSSQTPTM